MAALDRIVSRSGHDRIRSFLRRRASHDERSASRTKNAQKIKGASSMSSKNLFKGLVALLVATSIPAVAGSWQTQTVIANGGLGPWIAIDGSGNLAVAWGYSVYPINENLARTGAIGQPWSSTVDLPGPLTGVLDLPQLHASASGNFTAIYNEGDPAVSMFVDHPAGGNWTTPAVIPGSSEAGQITQYFPTFTSNDRGDQATAWGARGA